MAQDMVKKERKVEKNNEEQRKELAKIYGLSLEDIKHVQLENGKEFFKFYNPKDRSVKMVENIDHGINMSQEFKNLQQELSFTQSKDAKNNAEEIYNHNLEHKNIELTLVPVAELKGNKYSDIRQINRLSTVDRKRLMALLRSASEIDLSYVNIENAVGIDINQDVIDVDYDYKKNRAVIKKARVLSYENKNEMVNEENYVVEITDTDIELVLDEIVIADSIPTITEEKEIMIQGENINTKTVIDCYNMPEVMDRMNLSKKQKHIYSCILSALKNIIKGKQGENSSTKVRQLTKKNTYRNVA